ncbi:MAG: hypothetical protein DRJ60_07410 [Thermoprotei archaeon]|nr:MAG: hypothetical protein DRJ60_07410 [Thermoprotei archaeon]
MPKIEIRNISNYALRDVSLEVENGELMVILGPSGSGKTTLLNVIAGLTDYDGSVLFDGVPIDSLKPYERDIGYVPQDLALFNHLNVRDNIAFGLRMRGLSEDVIDEKVKRVMEMLNIRHLAHRYPLTLSGGEQQRVAIARAIVLEPKVLLMDEPFSNLDVSLRRNLRMELKALQRRLKLTTIFVTHDIIEAEELADRVAVLVKGEIRGVGTFNEVFFNSTDPIVREVLGSPNILNCNSFRLIHDGLAEVECEGIKLLAPHDDGVITRIAIPPERVILTREFNPKTKFNMFKGIVEQIVKDGSLYKITISIKKLKLLSVQSEEEYSSSPVNVGDEVYVKLPIKHIKTMCIK